VLEYFDGGSVSTVLQNIKEKKREPLTEKQQAYILMQASAGITYLHSKNIIHRGLI
jgi:serine/threonine protein kinase